MKIKLKRNRISQYLPNREIEIWKELLAKDIVQNIIFYWLLARGFAPVQKINTEV